MLKQGETLVGTSFGLAIAEYSGVGCEQAYVVETGDERRPIRIEFWEGYAVPNRAILTRNQAEGIATLLRKWAKETKPQRQTGLFRELKLFFMVIGHGLKWFGSDIAKDYREAHRDAEHRVRGGSVQDG